MWAKLTAVIVGLFALQLVLVAILLGVFHSPMPHNLPVAVVGRGPMVDGLVKQLDATPALAVRRVDDSAQARALIQKREIYGAYAPLAKAGIVLVASAASVPVAGAVPAIFAPIDAMRKVPQVVKDVAPLPANDSGGASGYFLALIALIAAAFAGLIESAHPSIRRGWKATLRRIVGLAVFAGLSGLLLAEYANALGVFKSNTLTVAAILAVTIFAVTTTASLYTSVLGTPAGLGLGLGVFVLLGVLVTSGGASAKEFVPDFWRTIGGLLPPRATIDLIRNYAYFDGNSTSTPWLVLEIYSGLGIIAMLALSPFRRISR